MRLVYIDEAGIGNPSHEPFLVVAGVGVDADKSLIAVERHLDRLVERFIPDRHKEGFVFHATELFNGGGKVFTRRHPPDFIGPNEWPLERRLSIADQLAAIPKKFNLLLSAGFVERSKFPLSNDDTRDHFSSLSAGEKIIAQHVSAFASCGMHVEHWMRLQASDEVCMLIVEDTGKARQLMRDTMSHLQRLKIHEIEADERPHFPFRKIKEDPLFESKRSSSVLQIADFCAYVFKRYLMDRHDERFLRFFRPMQPYFSYLPDKELLQLSAKADRRVKKALIASRRPAS